MFDVLKRIGKHNRISVFHLPEIPYDHRMAVHPIEPIHVWHEHGARPPIGASPGTILIDPAAHASDLTLIAYGPDAFIEKKLDGPDDIVQHLAGWPVVWINVDGLGTESVLIRLSEMFGIHVLAIEDIVNTHQRAKTELYPNHLFVVARMMSLGERVHSEQVSFLLGANYLITFQERPGDCFEAVRTRIRRGGIRIRSSGPDYLCYALLDAIVDAYYPILEEVGERLDHLQQKIIARPRRTAFLEIHALRRDLRLLRRAIWPMRDVFNLLCRDPITFIRDETRVFLRDCYDQTVQVVDLVETHREMGGDLTDLYLSSLSNRMNEIMKVLTIIATIFMPLTFIAGIYGMNFNPERSPFNMPELNWYYGYPFSLGLMLASALGMLFYFWRKGWIGGDKEGRANDSLAEDDSATDTPP